MDDGMYSYQPKDGHGLPHDPLLAIIGPRPIGWISSQDTEGRHNLAPYSFFNAFAYRPPIIGFSSAGRKDSLDNAEATREFVWNLATKPLAEAMNKTSTAVPHEVSEFELAGLTPAPSTLVKPPRVRESPVSFECRVTQIVRLHAADATPMPNWLVLGEVVAVHIAKSLLQNGVFQTAEAHPILRAGGMDAYAEIVPEIMFKMPRPSPQTR